jgi:acyl-CoA synthetase (AMP-forming)/AMP-acid ligase II
MASQPSDRICSEIIPVDVRVVVTSSARGPSASVALQVLTKRAAAALRALSVVRAGARVATWRVSQTDALALSFAIADADGVAVWLNDRWNANEAARAIGDADPAILLIGARQDAEELATLLEGRSLSCFVIGDTGRVLLRAASAVQSLDANDIEQFDNDHHHISYQHPITIECLDPPDWQQCLGSSNNSAVTQSSGMRPSPAKSTESVPAPTTGSLPMLPYAIVYTSGTTGWPKGVVLSHRAMLVQALAKLQHVRYNALSRYLHLAPLFHVGGASSALAVTLACGSHLLIVAAPPAERPKQLSTSISETCAVILRFRVNTLVVVPAMLQMLLDEMLYKDFKFSIDTLLYGGGSLSTGLRLSVQRSFPNCMLIGAYGMTETASSMTFINHSLLPLDSPAHSSVGAAPEHVMLRIVDSVQSFRTNDGFRVGEISTRGPHVMNGYFRRQEETRAALQAGWLRTGDLGYLDDGGNLFLVGRAKDMIKSGGENVFAGEVEAVLARHPAVASSAVVGVPHRVLGEAVAAAVIATEWPGEEMLAVWCREGLSSYKRPRWILEMDCFPLSSTGKVLKDQLRTQILDTLRMRPKL